MADTMRIRRTGYMYSKGRIMRRWKRKFFVLDGSLLRYYHDEKDIREGAAPNGIVTLANCSIHEGGVSDTWGSLRIHLSDGAVGRVYCFSGPEPEEIVKWYSELESVINAHYSDASGKAQLTLSSASQFTSASAGTSVKTLEFQADDVSGGEGDDDDLYEEDRYGRESRDLNSALGDAASGAEEDEYVKSRLDSSVYPTSMKQHQRVSNLLRARAVAHSVKSRKRNHRLQRLLRKGLADSVKSLVSLYRELDAWQLVGVEQGMRVSILKPSVASDMGLAFPTPLDISKSSTKDAREKIKTQRVAKGQGKGGSQPLMRGVCVIKAPPSAVSRLIMDVRQRKHWDSHFHVAEEVDACFPRTQLVRLRGRLSWHRNPSSSLDRVCRAASAAGARLNVKTLASRCRSRCCSVVSSAGSVFANAAVAGAMSAGAAALAQAMGHDSTIAAVSGAALAGAALWNSSHPDGSVGVGVTANSGAGTYKAPGSFNLGPVSIDVEKQASNRTMLCVQHLCTMGRDSDVIVERSIKTNNPKYKKNSNNSTRTNKKGVGKYQDIAEMYPLASCVEATAGVSGWIIEPLIVRERVVSQVTFITSLDGGGWIPADMNASLPLERLSCLMNLRELAAQTLDTDSWGAEMDSMRGPGDLWEPEVESYWTVNADYPGNASDSSDDDSSRKRSRAPRDQADKGKSSESKGTSNHGAVNEEARPAAGNLAGWSAGTVAPGSTIRKGTIEEMKEDDARNLWCDLPQTDEDFRDKLMVRGPDYLTDKVKIPSSRPLFRCVTMDIFPTKVNVPNLHEQFAVPQGVFVNDGETEGVCHTFIYNAMMPAYEASMWGAKKGKSHNVVAWFTLNEWVKKQLRGEEPECPAVSQLREWSKHGDPMHKQFKTIVRVANPDILDAGFTVRKLIDQYNGKPFLSNVTHKMDRVGNTIVLNFDVHIFSFLARKIYFEQHGMFPKLILDVGFVVQGNEDKYLPEQLLACMRLCRFEADTHLAGLSDTF